MDIPSTSASSWSLYTDCLICAPENILASQVPKAANQERPYQHSPFSSDISEGASESSDGNSDSSPSTPKPSSLASFSPARDIVAPSAKKPFRCSSCGKCFSRKYHLTRHNLTHLKERAYRCSICGKNFTQNSHLTRHTLIHTGERKHKCSYCDKTFLRNDDLVVHRRVHTGEKPYICSVCGKSFSDSSNRAGHNRRVHNKEKS